MNKYSLTNHIKRCGLEDHTTYYNDVVAKKFHCKECNRLIDKRSKSKEICFTCLHAKKEGRKIIKELVKKPCFECQVVVEVFR